MQIVQHPTQALRDPDEALWDKARGLLAEELGIDSGVMVADTDRHYIEEHATAYAAALIAEDDELEALYDEAHARLAAVLTAELLVPPVCNPGNKLIAIIAPIVVHAALEARI